MNISSSPLTVKQKDFLKSEKSLGFNKSQYQNDIMSRLEKSIVYLHHIMQNTHNLKKNEIYEIVNAKNLYEILDNILKNMEKFDEKIYEYDFRTAELARLLFQISSNYLKNSPAYKNNKFLYEEVERVSQRFRDLSNVILQYETIEILSEQELNKLKSHLDDITNKIQEIMNRTHFKKLRTELEELQMKYDKTNKSITYFHERIKKAESYPYPDLRMIDMDRSVAELEQFKLSQIEKDLNQKREQFNQAKSQHKELSDLIKQQEKEKSKMDKYQKLRYCLCPIDILTLD